MDSSNFFLSFIMKFSNIKSLKERTILMFTHCLDLITINIFPYWYHLFVYVPVCIQLYSSIIFFC